MIQGQQLIHWPGSSEAALRVALHESVVRIVGVVEQDMTTGVLEPGVALWFCAQVGVLDQQQGRASVHGFARRPLLLRTVLEIAWFTLPRSGGIVVRAEVERTQNHRTRPLLVQPWEMADDFLEIPSPCPLSVVAAKPLDPMGRLILADWYEECGYPHLAADQRQAASRLEHLESLMPKECQLAR